MTGPAGGTSITVPICPQCGYLCFVSGHPRNMCGHNVRAEQIKFVASGGSGEAPAGLTRAEILALLNCGGWADLSSAQAKLRAALRDQGDGR